MLINEIFTSIDGEAKRAGELATFIRTVGCNLRCSYCDTPYSFEKDENTKVFSISEIVEECKQRKVRNITFTGGEPLLQKDADELIEALAEEGFDVSIETNGSIDFTKRSWFKNNIPNVWVCVDYKCYESGEQEKMIPIGAFMKLREKDVLKFVVGSEKDLHLAKDIIELLKDSGVECLFYISPVFGKIELKEIIEFMLYYNMQGNIRFQLQLHKFIWDPNTKGV